jgi:hypothetical protein
VAGTRVKPFSRPVTDRAGVAHDLRNEDPGGVEIVKPGPLYVVVPVFGRLAVDVNYSVPFTLTVEMPNGKSWVKYVASVEDPAQRLREIALTTPAEPVSRHQLTVYQHYVENPATISAGTSPISMLKLLSSFCEGSST